MITFDEWRQKYDKMTLEEQVSYHNQLEKLYPEQAHYSYGGIREAFSFAKPKRVLEFGTWKGDLANLAIPEFQIESWKGIEICEAAIRNTHCRLPQFSYIMPSKFDWFIEERTEEADLIIGTHFIEHLSNEHFDKLAEYCRGVKFVYFEAPLTIDGQDWVGYHGTHKLIYGWRKVEEVMANNGYKLHNSFHDARFFICE